MTRDSDTSRPPGHEHLTEVKPDFHDRLSTYWPEPRDQLHMGGWAATIGMAAALDLGSASRILDLCCGEGATARWLARQYGNRVVGVDIVGRAVAYARQQTGPGEMAFFAQANVFQLPFADQSIDAILGQDPDGLAHHARAHAFRECWRVLRPGGILGLQHWLLHDGVPPALVADYNNINAELGFPSMRRLQVSDYIADMQTAGFIQIEVQDLSGMYQAHMEGIERLAKAGSTKGVDRWTALVLSLMRQGYRIGAGIIARRSHQ